MFLAFASGHLAKSLLWAYADLIFAYFAHAQIGLPADQTGWIVFISMAYSGFLDLSAALLLSRFPGQERHVPRAQLVGAIITAVGVVMLFTPMPMLPSWLFGWLLATSLFFRSGYALYDLSQNALVTLLPRDEVEARRYVTVRTTLSYVAKIVVALASFAIIGNVGPSASALVVILPIALLTLLSAYPLSRPIDRHDEPEGALEGSAPPVRLLSPVLIAVLAQTCLLGVIGRFLPFARDAATGEAIGATLVLASVFGGLAGPILASRLLRHKDGFALANLGFTAGCVLFATMAAWAQSKAQLIAVVSAMSVCGGGISVLVWSQLAGVIRAHARTSGRRADLASFALLTAAIKLGAGAAGLFLGEWLEGYEAREIGALSQISAATLVGGAISGVCMAYSHRRLTSQTP